MIPETYKIDFDTKRLNLTQQNLNRVLCQFKDAPVISQVVSAYSKQYQELHNAIIDLQELRTLYNAKGVYADTIGRILGRNRQIVFENGFNEFADDSLYSDLLLLQTCNNTNKHSSSYEISYFFKTALGFDVSVINLGVMSVILYVPVGTSDLVELYTNPVAESNVMQGAFVTPFPATLTIPYVSEFEVLLDIGGSGKHCRIEVSFDGADDSGADMYSIVATTSKLNVTPIKQFLDKNGSGKNCSIQAKLVGVDDFGADIWELILATTLSNKTAMRKLIAINDIDKKCRIESVYDFNNDVWSLLLTSI